MMQIAERQKRFFETGKTRDLRYRIEALKKLYRGIQKHRQSLLNALSLDLGKCPFESYETEIGLVLQEIRNTIQSLPQWAKPERVKVPFYHFPASARVFKEPYGVVLVVAPWNYPVQLTLFPLAAILAAGNCAVIKPSPLAMHTAAAIQKLIEDCFEPKYVAVIRAKDSIDIAGADFIFFTGSTKTGQKMMSAAAEKLIPIALELGGKSPCIVDHTANIPVAARRIIWGKCLNAGQTCVAPDYILVEECVKSALITEMQKAVRMFYGEHPIKNTAYGRIINHAHFDRLRRLIENEHVISGGRCCETLLKIEPTILADISWDSEIMQEEIFGPVLPVLPYQNLNCALQEIKKRPQPLALYLFSRCKKVQSKVMHFLDFGGGCINDTVIHLTVPGLPFGGRGGSGIGKYHGIRGFQLFSHEKSIVKKSSFLDLPFRYPPYDNKTWLLHRVLK